MRKFALITKKERWSSRWLDIIIGLDEIAEIELWIKDIIEYNTSLVLRMFLFPKHIIIQRILLLLLRTFEESFCSLQMFTLCFCCLIRFKTIG